MATIFKYIMPLPGDVEVHHIPVGWKPLAVQRQDRAFCLWAEVDTTQKTDAYTFHTIGTGWEVPDNAQHLGTVQDNSFVWHVYRSAA